MSVLSYLESNDARIHAELFDFLRIPSVSARSEHRADVARAADWLADRMRAAGLSAEVLHTGGHPVVLGEWRKAPPGAKTILAEFRVQSDTNAAFTLPITLKLGLSDVGLQTLALRDGSDVIVQQMITNYGEKPIDYTAFAIFPGQARQERLVTNLGAGRTTIKKYRFINVEMGKDVRIRSGVKELLGARILNDEVMIQ